MALGESLALSLYEASGLSTARLPLQLHYKKHALALDSSSGNTIHR